MSKWSKKEVEYLKFNYEKLSIEDIASNINKTKHSVANKASRLFLTKSKNNKTYTKEELIQIVGKHKSRVEFRDKDWSAYKWANNYDLLDDICEYDKSFSIPQLVCKEIMENILQDKCLYNTRKIIPPYEIDIYFEKYKLGFEYNGKGWHSNNENDLIKNHLAIDNNIKIITIVENSRKYEEDIKKQLIDNLESINKLTSKNITPNEINNVLIDTYSLVPKSINLEEEIQKYKSYKHLKEKNINLYYKIKRYKKIHLIYELIGK